ncbi:MAG: ATP-binding cassette domain-containing protein [Candidatus Tectomicrobia bacterium]|nr:ATP-binding cassette domain-containing protein [Candidatus Tectomicrobia bacterium]
MSEPSPAFQYCDVYLAGVRKAFGPRQPVLVEVTLDVLHGEFVLLTGPSGAGKSTLLRLLHGELRPDAGEAVVLGTDLATLRASQVHLLRRQVGMIFQDFKLLPRRTLFDNVALGLRVLGQPRRAIERRVRHLLHWVGLGRRVADYPGSLSGGEQQRAAVARAVAAEPRLLLADEPTGNLDAANALDILQLLSELNLRGTTVLLASHDASLQQHLEARVMTLEHGKVLGSHGANR